MDAGTCCHGTANGTWWGYASAGVHTTPTTRRPLTGDDGSAGCDTVAAGTGTDTNPAAASFAGADDSLHAAVSEPG